MSSGKTSAAPSHSCFASTMAANTPVSTPLAEGNVQASILRTTSIAFTLDPTSIPEGPISAIEYCAEPPADTAPQTTSTGRPSSCIVVTITCSGTASACMTNGTSTNGTSHLCQRMGMFTPHGTHTVCPCSASGSKRTAVKLPN